MWAEDGTQVPTSFYETSPSAQTAPPGMFRTTQRQTGDGESRLTQTNTGTTSPSAVTSSRLRRTTHNGVVTEGRREEREELRALRREVSALRRESVGATREQTERVEESQRRTDALLDSLAERFGDEFVKKMMTRAFGGIVEDTLRGNGRTSGIGRGR